jgi:hypothetical protein
MGRTKNQVHQLRKRQLEAGNHRRKDRKQKEEKLIVDPATLLPTEVAGNKVCSPKQREQIVQFLLSHQDKLRPILASRKKPSNIPAGPKQKEKILEFIRSHQDKLLPINTSEENATTTTTASTPAAAPQLVVLGLVVPKDIHRLQSQKTIKNLGKNLQQAMIPFLTIIDVDILKLILDNSPENILGVEVSGIEDESLLLPMLAIVQDREKAKKPTKAAAKSELNEDHMDSSDDDDDKVN